MKHYQFSYKKEDLIDFTQKGLFGYYGVRDAYNNPIPPKVSITSSAVIGVILVLATIGFCIFKMK